LVEGVRPHQRLDRKKEAAFVFGENAKAKPKARPGKPAPAKEAPTDREKHHAPAASPATSGNMQALAGRVPLTTRIRPELAQALKRASLERQLSGETPNTVQDIVEQALEPLLKDMGYLKD
jgi:cell pole-organizing protein PopZ